MEVEFQMSKKDYVDFYMRYQKSILLKQPAFLIILSILIVIAVYIDHLAWWVFILHSIAYLIGALFFLYFIPLLFVFLSMKKIISKDKIAYLGKIKYTITEDGLKSEILNRTSLRSWESITKAAAIERYIFLKLAGRKLLIVPKKSFTSEVEAADFLWQIRTHTKQ